MTRIRFRSFAAFALLFGMTFGLISALSVQAAKPISQPAKPLPYAQDVPPGPALTPQEAMKRMVVPEGFTVELVAAEPDLVNPTAMTFDERGRIWITESLEYPRHSPGVGKDVIKVLESTKGDGHFDKITTFADGLNIPSGIAVGHGGVWVANSPDILFMQDTTGNGKADKKEVVVTGFGRFDTHEVPNSLTWGPDGYLYGLNGVFNEAHIQQNGKDFRFTCALYRINPRTREFEVFCEGTSNPWGLVWDPEGSAFISACVVDHLWHLTETGYYHRQGGPYPPFTWELPSIVDFHHQKAAYCGLQYLDSDALPAKYRDKLVMGNIHGNCLNVDVLHRNGSTYRATGDADLLTANDAWFMPVAQRIGPDGCLYILDWYDQYHCYQDASRDPDGVDRTYGRLYRLRYKNSPPAGVFDLSKETDEQLVERLHSGNIYFRETAQRVLAERGEAKNSASRPLLEKLVLDDSAPHKARMHALWALVGSGSLESSFHDKLLSNVDASIRAWGVRAAGNFHNVEPKLTDKIVNMAGDPSPDVLLQVAIAADKLGGYEKVVLHRDSSGRVIGVQAGNHVGADSVELLLDVLQHAGDDPLIPAIVWQNLQPSVEDQADEVLFWLGSSRRLRESPGLRAMMPRLVERILARKNPDMRPVADLVDKLVNTTLGGGGSAQLSLALLTRKIQTHELAGQPLDDLRVRLRPVLTPIIADGATSPLKLEVASLLASMGSHDEIVLKAVRQTLTSTSQPDARRVESLGALLKLGDKDVLDDVAAIFAEPKKNSVALRAAILAALGRSDDPRVAVVVLGAYSHFEPELQPRSIELLTQRSIWAKVLLDAVGRHEIAADSLNVNQVQRMLGFRDKELAALVEAKWGSVRTERNPAREKVVREMKSLITSRRGDPNKGWVAFKKICAQCHKIYGEGQDVGPDITSNGRASFDQLLSNVFDPSLVIGAGYQARIVTTTDGRVLTGLLAENNAQRIVLKLQGGKTETIPRSDVESLGISKLSLMPEGVEKQYSEQELIDLFEFLMLDKPPTDPTALHLPGVPR